MADYHPNLRFLIDFAAATLPESEAFCVSAHLEYCLKCRADVQQLTEIGGQLFVQQVGVEMSVGSFDQVMSRIDSGHNQETTGLTDEMAYSPKILSRAIDKLSNGNFKNLDWVQLGQSLRIAPLTVGNAERGTALYDIKAGGKMPHHGHSGEEITVVLKGSFSDLDGTYRKGDFVIRNIGESHQPIATQDRDCICLVSLESPIKPSAFFYKLINPYVQYKLSRYSNGGVL